jgi:hypothetical protein
MRQATGIGPWRPRRRGVALSFALLCAFAQLSTHLHLTLVLYAVGPAPRGLNRPADRRARPGRGRQPPLGAALELPGDARRQRPDGCPGCDPPDADLAPRIAEHRAAPPRLSPRCDATPPLSWPVRAPLLVAPKNSPPA